MGVRGTRYRDVVVLALMQGPARSVVEVAERIDEGHWNLARPDTGDGMYPEAIRLSYQNVNTRLRRLEREGWVAVEDDAYVLRTPVQRAEFHERLRREARPDARVLALVDQIERESGLKLRLETREVRRAYYPGAVDFERAVVLLTERGNIEYIAPKGMGWLELVRGVVQE